VHRKLADCRKGPQSETLPRGLPPSRKITVNEIDRETYLLPQPEGRSTGKVVSIHTLPILCGPSRNENKV